MARLQPLKVPEMHPYIRFILAMVDTPFLQIRNNFCSNKSMAFMRPCYVAHTIEQVKKSHFPEKSLQIFQNLLSIYH